MLVKSQVKYIQSLSHKKFRDDEGVFVAEGPKIINELLSAATVQPQQLYATEAWQETMGNVFLPVPVVTVTPAELERLSFLQTPNQVLGVFSKPALDPHLAATGRFTLMLDNIQDPGNMGTLVRTADWFGFDQVWCSRDCADVFNPKVVQATMGSIARVPVHYLDLLTVPTDVPVYAATLGGQSIYELAAPAEGILLIGNESKGVSAALLERCTRQVTIPRIGTAESLNASVAAGILMAIMRGGR